jgi:hypothetical protein
MPLFNVYSGQGTTFSLECRKTAFDATDAITLTLIPELWTKAICRAKPGEIVRDKSGKEWFAVKVNTIGET